MEFRIIHAIPNDDIMEGILQLHERIFQDSSSLIERMKTKANLLTIIALDQGKIVGFKMGYEFDPRKFYSWLGGVDEMYRHQGIASKLMEMQHNYLREHGYRIVQTKTKNKWRAMLILNIKHGFDIIGTYTDEKGEPKIILEKNLLVTN
ncbi:GNAT family N-acetyltransferase [Anoxybacteroides tepidamans]|uniref:GNAT family N-acetyltransferase n=1 Tax=Anoxybacteroides tepidamans TaxID=265948 RepID=UPI000485C03F|nr:GNAT family N-acetyltransferase [Anoxybacillus tepidamans]